MPETFYAPLSLIVNGEAHMLDVATLAQVLTLLAYEESIVATALNGEFVPRDAR